MIPLRDNIPPRTVPFVNYAFIAICAVVFFFQLAEDPEGPSLVERYGMIPVRVLHPEDQVMIPDVVVQQTQRGAEQVIIKRPAAEAAVPVWLTLLTCVFLHGGWMHFGGNMWFLFIFGDNVEDRYGHAGYLIFYILSGVAASATHLLAGPNSPIPTIGASGAIAGVMGSYFILYPKARVQALIPLGYIMQIMVVPAYIFLGIWFAIQFFQGAASSVGSGESGGVAWWAHIGGFVVGIGLTFLLKQMRILKPPVETIRPHTDHVGMYRVSPRHRR